MVSNFYHRAGEGPRPLQMLPDAVHPPEWAARLADLRVTPTELPGEVIRLFVPEYDRVDQSKDKRLHALAKILAETMSVHAAATEALEHAEWDFAAIYYDAIDHFGHGFMRYHPPRLEWVDEESFEIYRHIMDTAYRYHDAMLGRLIQLAGPGATVMVLSDHGFHSDARRPAYIPPEMAGPAIEHRHFGIFCLNGPGIRQGETLHGSVVLDIAPTLLHLYGLPVGQDMDGKALVNAFQNPVAVQTIPSWEQVAGNTGQHPPQTRLDPLAASEAMKQLIALGYVAPPSGDAATQLRECVTELKYNLARAYDDESRYDLSLPLYAALLAADPDDHRIAEHQIRALMRLGLFAQARTALQVFDAHCARRAPQAAAELERRIAQKANEALEGEQEPKARREAHGRARLRETAGGFVLQRALLRFQIDMHQGHLSEAEQSFGQLEQLCAAIEMSLPNLLVAELFARRGKIGRALSWVERALSADADDWQAQNLGAQLHLAARHYNKALEMAAASLGLVYHQPLMHYVMGYALMGKREYAAAEQPLRIAIAQMPGFARAHDLLSRLYADHLNRPDEAARHFLRAESLRRNRKTEPEAHSAPALIVAEAESRPTFPSRAGVPCADASREILVVCGLPRSGTSMLMQMLAAGGIPPLTDGLRSADEDNPRGYFEYEQATRLHQDKKWVVGAHGKAVKLVLPLVPFLPSGYAYRFLVIQRDLGAVLASQQQMLSRLGREAEGAALSDDALRREYCAQERRVADWLRARTDTPILPMEYDAIVSDPCAAVEQIAAFAGRAFDVTAATQAVDPALKRQAGHSR